MHRFFVPPELLRNVDSSSLVLLPEKQAHQAHTVLHLAPGEQLVLLDNSGDEYFCSVVRSGRKEVAVRMEQRRAGLPEPTVHITLCQGLVKSARFEWILEKGTECGVTTFAPILCRRSTAGLEEAGPSKIQRWQRIIQEAAEQCGRARLPQLLPIRSLAQTLAELPPEALAIMPWEEEHGKSLRDVLRSVENQEHRPYPKGTRSTVVLFIGPEGGLVAEEIELARGYGVQAVTLGPRILRAETAAIASVANVMYELEH